MPQISKATDERLNILGLELTHTEKALADAEADKARIWVEVFEAFDEHGYSGEGFEFLVSDGKKLQRRKSQGKSVLDANKLKSLIFERYPKAQAEAIWEGITRPPEPIPPPQRVVDPQLVERATLLGIFDAQGQPVKIRGLPDFKLPTALVNDCITTAEDSFGRYHPDWSKEDKLKAQALGIKLSAEKTE